MDDTVGYRPIGTVHSPLRELRGAPIQPVGGGEIRATVEVFPEYQDGLKDIEGFSHLILLCHFHRAGAAALRQTPYIDDQPRGIFAIRSPHRPNPIGFSIVRLLAVKGNILEIGDVDILDGTPVLDIKPYLPDVDCRPDASPGWTRGKTERFRHQRATDPPAAIKRQEEAPDER